MEFLIFYINYPAKLELLRERKISFTHPFHSKPSISKQITPMPITQEKRSHVIQNTVKSDKVYEVTY